MSGQAKSSSANDRNDDKRGAATKHMLQMRKDAASAKRENRMTGKSASSPSDCGTVNGSTVAKPTQMLQAANRPDELKLPNCSHAAKADYR